MQFKPPSNPGWIQPEPEQQEFPQQQASRPFFQQLEQPPDTGTQPTPVVRPGMYYPPRQPVSPIERPANKRSHAPVWIALFVLILASVIYGLHAVTAAPTLTDTDIQATVGASTGLSLTLTASQSDAATVAAVETADASQNTTSSTPMNQPTDTSTPVSQPTTVPATSVPTFATFTDGTFQVGTDIQPGTYRTQTGSQGCYYARLKGFGGTTSDILANNLTDYPAIVTILPADKGFESKNCGTWTTDLSQITTSKTTFAEGMYFVGTDIAPGTYKNTASSGCYYARLRGFSNSTNDIIANNLTDAATIVTIQASDKGFESTRCGTWTKL